MEPLRAGSCATLFSDGGGHPGNGYLEKWRNVESAPNGGWFVLGAAYILCFPSDCGRGLQVAGYLQGVSPEGYFGSGFSRSRRLWIFHANRPIQNRWKRLASAVHRLRSAVP